MKRRKNYSGTLEMKIIPYIFIMPNALIFILFITIPAIFGFYFSLTDWKGIGESVFIGFENYVKAFSDAKFLQSLQHTCVYVIVTLPLIMTVPLFLANLMIKEVKGKSLFRGVYYWPSMISYIVAGISIKFFFGDDTGIVNYILTLVSGQKVEWLTQDVTAMLVVVLATVWSRAGFYMVIYISGLQNISISYYEAANIDGANSIQKFRLITLPLLKPTTLLVMILGLTDLFKAYGLVISLTGGGPGTATRFIVQYIYEKAFSEFSMGYASALSIILLVIMVTLTILQFVLNKGGSIDD